MSGKLFEFCSAMKEYGCGVYVISSREIIGHILDLYEVSCSAVLFVRANRDYRLFVGKLDVGYMTDRIDVSYMVTEYDQIVQWLQGISTITFCELMTVAFRDLLENKLANLSLTWVKDTCIYQMYRVSKSVAEVKNIVAASRAAEEGFVHILKLMVEGVTEVELVSHLKSFCIQRFPFSSPAFNPIVAFSSNSANEHHCPGHRRLSDGDVVMIDMGLNIGGFCSDFTRTFSFGVAKDAEFYKVWEVVLGSKTYSESLLQIKAPMCTVHDQAAKFISDNGYGGKFTHGLGHGIGVFVHEMPSYVHKEHAPFGSVVTVEPGIYLKGRFGVRLEDCWFIGENGNVRLNVLPVFPEYCLYKLWMR